jgi:hypothetical protein
MPTDLPGTRYAADELAAVAQLLGAPGFPGVDGLGEEAEREASLRSARRSLLARGVLELDSEGVLSIAAPHAFLFGLALAPAATVVAQRGGAETEGRAWYLHPTAAVEHTVPIGAVHGLEQIDSANVMPRLLDFLRIGAGREGGGALPFTTDRAAIERISAALSSGDLSGLGADLPADASGFVDALGSLVGSSYVRVLHRSGSKIVGGELSWVDAGNAGLWLIEPVAGDPDQLTVRQVASRDLVDELLSYLPGGEAQPAT